MAKVAREKFKTYGGVFDQSTLLTLFKLSNQGHFDSHEDIVPISRGKEAHVFIAKKRGDIVAVKIYNVQNCDFNRMFDYLRCDPSYQDVKRSPRGIVFAWTQKEYRNLLKARNAGVRVPTPYAFANNILLLECIGDPAPKLKDVLPDNPEKFFDTLLEEMRKLHKAGIVHGDLSQFNILNHENEPVLIDFSQSTSLKNPNYELYLRRDIKNVCSFFARIGVKKNMDDVYRAVTNPYPL